MREILFRGKRRDNGEWVYGMLCYDSSGHPINIEQCGFDKPYEGVFPVVPETIGQYINEVDSTKKKIFEGDIDTSDSDAPMYVAYKGSEIGMKFGNREDYLETCIQWNMTEITGNIHDNPQLLSQ